MYKKLINYFSKSKFIITYGQKLNANTYGIKNIHLLKINLHN